VFAQHRQLHPDLGPEPWGARLRELERSLIGVQPTAEPVAPPASDPVSPPEKEGAP
jgi:hypothetical protein